MDERMDVDRDAARNDDESVDTAGARPAAMTVEENDNGDHENHNDNGDEKEKVGGVSSNEPGGGKAGLIKKFLESEG